MEVGLESGEASLGAIESVLCRIGCRDADLGEACRLFDQSPHRLFMNVAQRAPFLLNDAFEILQSLVGILLHARAGVAKLAQVRFELADRLRVAIGGGGPLFQDGCAVFGERREPLFQGACIGTGSMAHRVDLRLQIREALLKSDVVRLRANHVRA